MISKKKATKFLLVLFACITAAIGVHAQEKPNVVLFVIDDLSYDILSVNGNLTHSTPRIDSLARNGVQFTNCYSQPSCAPSRAKLLTGKYNFRNYTNNKIKLTSGDTTLGHVMRSTGYTTGFVGKNHVLYRYQNNSDYKVEDMGFDNYSISLRKSDDHGAFLNFESGATRTMDFRQHHFSEYYLNWAKQFIKDKREDPFFLFYSMHLAHEPHFPTPLTRQTTPKPQWKDNNISNYKDVLAYIDYIVGEIKVHLEQLGLDQNTVIIVTADNASEANVEYEIKKGETKQGAKPTNTIPGTHVPLIVYWPQVIKKGKEYNVLVDFTDLMPTLADLGGTTCNSDGNSLFNAIINNGLYEPKKFIVGGEYTDETTFVFDGKFKFYRSGKVYRVDDDPMETRDVNVNRLPAEDKHRVSALVKAFASVFGATKE